MRQLYLPLWNNSGISDGTETYGHMHAETTTLSVFGNIQPVVLSETLRHSCCQDDGGGGLFPWFLLPPQSNAAGGSHKIQR